MNPFLLIIILDFTHLAYCSDYCDSTKRKSHPSFKSLIRSKRDQISNVPWRDYLDSSSEFIVNVPDDEPVGVPKRAIPGINILHPNNVKADKIIGYELSSPQRTTVGTAVNEFYTRFKPPVQAPVPKVDNSFLEPLPVRDDFSKIHPSLFKEEITVEPESRLAPQNIPPIKNPQRDESPPAVPQFLPRKTSLQPRRQFAPVIAVGFSTRATTRDDEAITPRRRVDYSRNRQEYPLKSDVVVPSRTTKYLADDLADDLVNFVHNVVEDAFLTRTTTLSIPKRSTTDPNDINLELELSEDDQDLVGIDSRKYLNSEDFPIAISSNGVDNTLFKDNESSKNKPVTSKEKNYDNSLEVYYDSMEDDIQIDNATESELHNDDEFLVTSSFMNESKNIYKLISEQFNDSIEYKPSITSWKENEHLCSLLKLRPLGFNSSRTLSEIVSQLEHWHDQSPIVKLVDITEGTLTTMENPIHMVIVDDPSSGQMESAKQTVMLVAGILGKDRHAVTAAMYVLYQLINRSENHYELLNKFRFWIIPVLNPDGYEYAMTFPHRRDWSKNLHQTWEDCGTKEHCKNCQSSGIGCIINSCFGTNLDRNFEYQWIPANKLKSDQKCGELYPGPRQLSEAETRALINFMTGRLVPYMFVTFKEGDVLGVMYPHSHTKKKRAHDKLHRVRAQSAAGAATSISGRHYVAGQTSEFLPLYAGGIEDWVEGHLGVDKTYTVMLFRSSDGESRPIMERVVHEGFAALDTLVFYKDNGPKVATTSLRRAEYPFTAQSAQRTAPLVTLVVALVILLFS